MVIVSNPLRDPDLLFAESQATTSENDEVIADTPIAPPSKKDLKFWFIFASMCTCLFLSALETSSISTALPTIAHDLQASQFVWVGSAYGLSSTAFLPMSGGLAQTFGRRHAILIAISFFTLGSGICGGANSMNMLIVGRAIQGLGGGGIQSLTGIILADLVSLKERGIYSGLFGLACCFATSIGPVIGGSLAAYGYWRWLFYLNLPISFVAFLFVVLIMDLPTPPGNYRGKVKRVDWPGNFVVIASTVAYTIGLTWGGTIAPWSSVTVIVPLVLGLLGLVVFITYEATIATHPLVPLALMTNATSISGYIQSFCIAINTMAIVYFFPVYLQACKGLSPIQSGVYTLGLCAFAPASVLAGISVRITGRYRPQMWTAWVIVLAAMSSLSAPTADAMEMGVTMSLGHLILVSLGTGMLYAMTVYPIQAPLSVTQNAPALAWMWFLRSFAGVLGVTIGSTVLQNQLVKALPVSITSGQYAVPVGPSTGANLYLNLYALIPELSTWPENVRLEVQNAFAHSLTVLWRVLTVICAVGGVASLFMQGLGLRHALDSAWTIQHEGDGLEKDEDVDEKGR